LSIELPRMNGFSVCNKLKKDASLKDIPLVIMSSESSEETFEQHKKLRTRAEDYVHKPIAFGELLERIRAFVKIEAAERESSNGIMIDDAALVLDEATESGDLEFDAPRLAGSGAPAVPVIAPPPAPAVPSPAATLPSAMSASAAPALAIAPAA